MFRIYTSAVFIFISVITFAQTGLTVSPPRTYFESTLGETQSKKIIITNPSKSSTLNLTASLNDWEYDENGNNVISEPGSRPNSLAKWITLRPQAYFVLEPGESHELEIIITTPTESQAVPVHTSLLFITQTNPVDSFTEKGAQIKVSVRTGVKLYHRFSEQKQFASFDFTDFIYDAENKLLKLQFQNNGNIWTDGTLETELIEQASGKKVPLEEKIIYSMPGDTRHVRIPLPTEIKPGKYIATSTFSYGETDTIKMAELTFTYE